MFKKSTLLIIALLIVVVAPTFARMLRPGIYSMQDYHFFRLYEFDRCVRDLQIPCRWSPDAGLGFGEPLFNFYGQLAYVPGAVLHLLGVSLTDSLKLLFIFSLFGSALTMFFLARQIWGNNSAAFLSSVLYVWAPYRAIDVWVRGALPEALSFVIFPLVVYRFNLLVKRGKAFDLLLFSVVFALLILTHNLSTFMFGFFLLGWIFYKLISLKKFRVLPKILGGFILSGLLSAFYLLPVVFESQFVRLENMTQGYFDFRGHFAGIWQLLFSRFWGYGASLFGPNDDLNISIGHLQWIIPLLALVVCVVRSRKNLGRLVMLVGMGWFLLFLTHNKSSFIWESFPQMAFIQFPWRFLAVAVFAFSLAGGAFVITFGRYAKFMVLGLSVFAVFLNYSFFKEDIWRNVGDKDITSGIYWEEQTRASIQDYWPRYGNIPPESVPSDFDNAKLVDKKSNVVSYYVTTQEKQEVQFPVTYFPGWVARIESTKYETHPTGEYGLVTSTLPQLNNTLVTLEFRDTFVRLIGNVVSMVSFVALVVVFGIFRKRTHAT
ncbi:MAG: hypothetical protein HYU80_01970 [Candidatus Blackburnbacteria bacterium]|nr:hypothetical protein [Candidatus Blackburnbacteria bacterium]